MSTISNQQTSAYNFRLAMKIGLGRSDLLSTTIGDDYIRLEYLLAGSSIDRCTEAEQPAAHGAVVVSNTLLPPIAAEQIHSLAAPTPALPENSCSNQRYMLPMVENHRGIERCTAFFNQSYNSHSHIIGISAEAGMGKSRLIAELLRSSAAKQLSTFERHISRRALAQQYARRYSNCKPTRRRNALCSSSRSAYRRFTFCWSLR